MRGAVARVTDVPDAFAVPPFGGTLAALLRDRAERRPDDVLLTWQEEAITVAEIEDAARSLARMLRRRGVGSGDRVLTLVDPGPNYVALFMALALVGAVWVPQAPDAQGPSLAHVLSVVRPVLVIAAPGSVGNLLVAGAEEAGILEFDGWNWPDHVRDEPFEPALSEPDSVGAVLFTSGTTGPPKGVIVTERMLLASAAGCAFASKCERGDVFLMWEPMHHIGGPQLFVMALIHAARLVVIKRFSASGFWPTVRDEGVTKLHYLGGILEILLKAAVRPDDRDHPIGLAFGGGCRSETRRDFKERFGIPVREVFGMTEASSFTTVDDRGTPSSIGQVLPWMEVALVGEDCNPVSEGAVGEIAVRPRVPGLLTPGYLGDAAATARLRRGDWLHTGDLGRRDGDGNYFFLGRKTDSLRRRGENISAWEVETALAAHADVAETAILGVPSEIGEADILCLVLMREGAGYDPSALAEWCRKNLPRNQVPRYWKEVAKFERTPSQRIRKDRLNADLTDAADTGDGLNFKTAGRGVI